MAESKVTGRARIPGIKAEDAPEWAAKALESQRKKWGAPLGNHLIYARCPEVFQGAQGMWGGLDRSGLIDVALKALINRRVALLNGCEF